MDTETKITRITGAAIPLRGNNIDTDRIIPSRYLKCVTFNELGKCVFEDDRRECREKGKLHPFDNEKYKEAEILFVNNNFGCGSSREHAPQSLMRWGIKGIIGESFAEIFYGNCVSLGIPCASLPHEFMDQLFKETEKKPAVKWIMDIEKEKISGPADFAISIPNSVRSQFLSGTWNPLQDLLANKNEIEKIAVALPYISGFENPN